MRKIFFVVVLFLNFTILFSAEISYLDALNDENLTIDEYFVIFIQLKKNNEITSLKNELKLAYAFAIDKVKDLNEFKTKKLGPRLDKLLMRKSADSPVIKEFCCKLFYITSNLNEVVDIRKLYLNKYFELATDEEIKDVVHNNTLDLFLLPIKEMLPSSKEKLILYFQKFLDNKYSILEGNTSDASDPNNSLVYYFKNIEKYIPEIFGKYEDDEISKELVSEKAYQIICSYRGTNNEIIESGNRSILKILESNALTNTEGYKKIIEHKDKQEKLKLKKAQVKKKVEAKKIEKAKKLKAKKIKKEKGLLKEAELYAKNEKENGNFVLKGFFIGMNKEMAIAVLNQKYSKIKDGIFLSFEDNKLEAVHLKSSAIKELFNIDNINFQDFKRLFTEGYNIPQFQLQNIRTMNLSGYVVTITPYAYSSIKKGWKIELMDCMSSGSIVNSNYIEISLEKITPKQEMKFGD